MIVGTPPRPAVLEDLAVAALHLARRFSAGGTLWCVAPGSAAHAHHVAVEFVHPVIVGKPALPAVAVTDDDPASTIRAAGRRGDAVLGIGDGSDDTLTDLLQRARAWGMLTVWAATAAAPPPGAADHVVTLHDDASVVRFHHLLWELSHVCLEHPAALHDHVGERAVDTDRDGDRCVTCADEGRVGEVRSVRDDEATVVIDGVAEEVATGLLDHVAPLDLVVVHAGTAITNLAHQ